MVKKVFTTAENHSAILGGGYKTPEVNVAEFQAEGVLCTSGMTEQFEDDYFDWN